MKFLALFLISLNAFAGSFIPMSKVGKSTDGITVYTKKSMCEKKYSETCINIRGFGNRVYHKIGNEMIDDISSPVWGTRSLIEACNGEQDCKDKALVKDCVDDRIAYYNAEYSEVWCNKITGYNKISTGRKIIVEDSTKKAQYETQKAQETADKMAMAAASKALECGKKVISRMLIQNKPKDLSKAQVRNLVKTYKDIKNLLETGSLESAREDILAVAVNEPVVTQADKDALVAELDACK
jgi:hypothetical protein